jgi:RNA polymerase sigma-70 factor (ECF subfamily)
MNTPETDSIVTRVLAGDLDAFELLVRSYQQEVWKVVSATLFNRQKAEDLVQTTFVNAYHHLDRYEAGRDFGAWLKEIARNEVRQEIRRSLREDRRLQLYQQQLVRDYDEPAESSQQALREEALSHCKERLPAASERLVSLRYDSGLNFEEIAARIGRNVEATRQQLARIRLALRECIKRQLSHP